MKKILLSTAAVFAVAGAASAEVTWSGDASIGMNDKVKDGFYWTAGLGVAGSQELNNGFTASLSLDVDLAPATPTATSANGAYTNIAVTTSDFVGKIASDALTVSFGDVDTARESFSPVTNTISNMDDAADFGRSTAGVLVESSIGGADVALSSVLEGSLANQYQLTAGTTVGTVDVAAYYAVEGKGSTTNQDEAMALTLGTSFAGVDVDATVARENDAQIMGVGVSYTMGAITVGGSYATNDSITPDDDKNAYVLSVGYAANGIALDAEYEDEYGTDKALVEGSYDFGNGLTAYAGSVLGSVSSYVAATYDLGGGAEFLASYAQAYSASETSDELGDPEFNSGLTLELSLDF